MIEEEEKRIDLDGSGIGWGDAERKKNQPSRDAGGKSSALTLPVAAKKRRFHSPRFTILCESLVGAASRDGGKRPKKLTQYVVEIRSHNENGA